MSSLRALTVQRYQPFSHQSPTVHSGRAMVSSAHTVNSVASDNRITTRKDASIFINAPFLLTPVSGVVGPYLEGTENHRCCAVCSSASRPPAAPTAPASEVSKKRRRSMPGWWGRRWSSLDDLIRPRQHRGRDRQAEGLGGLEV